MAEIMTESGTTHRETRIYLFRGVQVHRRKDAQGQFTLLDAIDEDEKKIRQIADRLQQHGYGVMRGGTTAPGAFIAPARQPGLVAGYPRMTLSTKSRRPENPS